MTTHKQKYAAILRTLQSVLLLFFFCSKKFELLANQDLHFQRQVLEDAMLWTLLKGVPML